MCTPSAPSAPPAPPPEPVVVAEPEKADNKGLKALRARSASAGLFSQGLLADTNGGIGGGKLGPA